MRLKDLLHKSFLAPRETVTIRFIEYRAFLLGVATKRHKLVSVDKQVQSTNS